LDDSSVVSGAKKYPVELPIESSDGEGPTVEDLANLAAQLTEVPRGSQRLIFKGTVNILCTISVSPVKIVKLFTCGRLGLQVT